MIILGLTGSIAMGKSEAARGLRRLGAAVFDADAEVHCLIGPGGAAVAAVAAAFPEAAPANPGGGLVIDRRALGTWIFGDDDAVGRLEAILHPLVNAAESRFLVTAAARRERFAVLNIPLLFETGGEERCDAIAVVVAPAFLQAQRALRRSGMTQARLEAVRARQMSDWEKQRRADFIIHTGLTRRAGFRALRRMVSSLTTGTVQGASGLRRSRHKPARHLSVV